MSLFSFLGNVLNDQKKKQEENIKRYSQEDIPHKIFHFLNDTVGFNNTGVKAATQFGQGLAKIPEATFRQEYVEPVKRFKAAIKGEDPNQTFGSSGEVTDPIRKFLYGGSEPVKTYTQQGQEVNQLVGNITGKKLNNNLSQIAVGFPLLALDVLPGGKGGRAMEENLVKAATEDAAKAVLERSAPRAATLATADTYKQLAQAGTRDEVKSVLKNLADNATQKSGKYFYNGVDEIPRQEISDAPSRLKIQPKPSMDGSLKFDATVPRNINGTTIRADATLPDILHHPELYKEFPEAQTMRVRTRAMGERTAGSFDPNTNSITLNSALSPEQFHSTVLHELQHAIQQRRGLPVGVSPQALKEQAERAGATLKDKEAYRLYKVTAGEAEARNAEARRLLTSEEIDQGRFPYQSTYDVKPKDQIVRGYGGDQAANSESVLSKIANEQAGGRVPRSRALEVVPQQTPEVPKFGSPFEEAKQALSPAQAKQEILGRTSDVAPGQERLPFDINGPSTEVPFVNKLKGRETPITMPETVDIARNATTKETKAGHIVPITRGKGIIVPPNVKDIVSALDNKSSSFLDQERRIELALKNSPDELKQAKDFLVEPRKQAVTNMIDDRVAYKKALEDEVVKGLGIDSKKLSAAVQDFGEKKITREDLVKRYGEEKAANIEKADAWFREQYDTLLNRVNEVRQQFGKDPIPRREDYYTHFQDLSRLEGVLNSDVGLVKNFVKAGVANPYAKARKGGAYTSDAISAFEHYLNPTLSEIHLTDPIQRGNAFADALEVESLRQGKDLNGFINRLRAENDALAGRPVGLDKAFMESPTGRRFLRTLQWTQDRISKNVILGSLRSAIMQTAQIPQAIGQNGLMSTIKGLTGQMAGALKGEDLTKISPFLRRRYADVSTARKGPITKLETAVGKPFELIETASTEAVWRSSYYNALKDGLKGDDAIKEADRLTQKIVSGRAPGEKPVAFESTIGSAAMQFQLEVNNLAQQLGKEYTPQQLARFFVAAYLFNGAMEKVTGQRPLPDAIQTGVDVKNDIQNKEYGAAIARPFGEVLSNVPGGQTLAGMIPAEARQKYFGKTEVGRYGGNLPVGETYQSFIQALTGPNRGKAASNLVSNIVTPFAGKPAQRAVEGVSAYNRGTSETPEGRVQFAISKDANNLVRSIVLGQYNTKEGQDYEKRALRPLSDTDSQRVKAIIDSQKDNPDKQQAAGTVATTLEFYHAIQTVSKERTKAYDLRKKALLDGNLAEAQKITNDYNTKLKAALGDFRSKSGQYLKDNPEILKLIVEEYKQARLSLSRQSIRSTTNAARKNKILLERLRNQ